MSKSKNHSQGVTTAQKTTKRNHRNTARPSHTSTLLHVPSRAPPHAVTRAATGRLLPSLKNTKKAQKHANRRIRHGSSEKAPKTLQNKPQANRVPPRWFIFSDVRFPSSTPVSRINGFFWLLSVRLSRTAVAAIRSNLFFCF